MLQSRDKEERVQAPKDWFHKELTGKDLMFSDSSYLEATKPECIKYIPCQLAVMEKAGPDVFTDRLFYPWTERIMRSYEIMPKSRNNI